jgi:2-keto-4-pentenoate hydratase
MKRYHHTRIGGWKAGATTLASQKKFWIPSPFMGPVFGMDIHDSPGTVVTSDFHMRGVEVEWAFRMGKDLPPIGRPYHETEVMEAVDAVFPALEIVGSRVPSDVSPKSLIADFGGHGALVVAPHLGTDVNIFM